MKTASICSNVKATFSSGLISLRPNFYENTAYLAFSTTYVDLKVYTNISVNVTVLAKFVLKSSRMWTHEKAQNRDVCPPYSK